MSTSISADHDEDYSISPAGHTRSVTSLIFTGIYFVCVISPLVIGLLGLVALWIAPFFLMGSILFAVLGALFDKGLIAGKCQL